MSNPDKEHHGPAHFLGHLVAPLLRRHLRIGSEKFRIVILVHKYTSLDYNTAGAIAIFAPTAQDFSSVFRTPESIIEN